MVTPQLLWAACSRSWQLEFFPDIQPKLSHGTAWGCFLLFCYLGEKTKPPLAAPSLQGVVESDNVPPAPPFLQDETTPALSCSSKHSCSKPFPSSVPLWMSIMQRSINYDGWLFIFAFSVCSIVFLGCSALHLKVKSETKMSKTDERTSILSFSLNWLQRECRMTCLDKF